MLWLAVESATLVASVAVGDDETILAEVTSHSALTHSERLLPMVDQTLKLAGIALAEVSRLVVSAGPGSFTGLRIGLSTVKGLAHARQLPIYPVSTLEALAYQQQTELPIVPLLDARRSQVYAAVYRRSEHGLIAVMSPMAIALTELLQNIGNQPMLFVGEGASLYRERIIAEAPKASLSSALHNWPRAGSLALLAWQDGRQPVDAKLLHPDYLRASSAEQKLASSISAQGEAVNDRRV